VVSLDSLLQLVSTLESSKDLKARTNHIKKSLSAPRSALLLNTANDCNSPISPGLQ